MCFFDEWDGKLKWRVLFCAYAKTLEGSASLNSRNVEKYTPTGKNNLLLKKIRTNPIYTYVETSKENATLNGRNTGKYMPTGEDNSLRRKNSYQSQRKRFHPGQVQPEPYHMHH